MITRFSPNIQGIILAFLGFACFSVADTTAKYLTQFYPTLQVVAFEAFCALIVCILLTKPLGGFQRTFKTKKRGIHLARAACNTLTTLLVTIGLAHLPLTTIYTLVFVSPFIIAIMAIPTFKERVDLHGWIAIVVGFAGVLIALRPGVGNLSLWVLAPLLSTLSIAGGFLLSRNLESDETLLSLGFFPVLVTTILFLPPSLYFYDLPSINHFIPFFLCSAALIAGLTLTAVAFRVGKSSIVSPIQYSQILWGVGVGYFIFGDVPDIWTLIGAAIIIASGIYLIETERRLRSIPPR